MTAMLVGGPAVSLIGGYYVADLTGSGTSVAVLVGLLMFGVVLAANAFGLRVSSGFQLGLSSILFGVVAVAVAVGLGVPVAVGVAVGVAVAVAVAVEVGVGMGV